ncbi:MAG TPA: glycosyltransferase family 2 protein, partial [Kofleriaceae bacterium]
MTTHVLWVLVHSLALVVFINRYVAGLLLRTVRGEKWDEVVDFEPTVTAVIPMFNEGRTVQETLRSILDSHYPGAKLKIICVDDCSTDNSYELAREVARTSNGRLRVMRNPQNMGKRRSIIRAVREARDAEIILSVDSDVVVDKNAVRELMRRFTSEKIAAVGGWIDVRNKQENWLTRMQVVRYWFAYHFSKNLEWGFRRVMCLSGCLTAYRRHVLIDLEPVLENRAICGVPIKYGEDRFLTRQVVKAGWLTTMTLTARCATTVPTTLSSYFSQQLRWRRSNTIDYAGGFTHVW